MEKGGLVPTPKSAANLSLTILAIAAMVVGLPTSTALSLAGGPHPGEQLAELCGDYEFNLTDAGLGILVVKFLVRDGSLWFQTASSAEPSQLEPVTGRDNAFTKSDPDEGLYEIEFLEDQGGGFTCVHLKNGTLDLDVVGKKLERQVHFPTLSERLRSGEGLAETRNDLNGTRVAIYFGRGMDGHSALAVGRAFQWMGCDVDVVDGHGIKRGVLAEFDVLAIPGGETNPDPWNDLGSDGKSEIQQFVRDGGGYVGICLGALFAAKSGDFWGGRIGEDGLFLDLFAGAAHCGQDDVAPKGSWPLMTDLTVSHEAHPIT